MRRLPAAALWQRAKRAGSDLHANIWVQISVAFLGGFYRNGLVAVWQPFVLYLGGSVALLGLLESLGGWGGLISSGMQLLGGWLADRLGRRPVMILASVLNALAMLHYTLAAALYYWPLLVPGVIFAGMGLVGRAANQSVTAESVSEGNRGLAYSLTMFAYIAPGMVSSVVAGQVTEHWKYLPVVITCTVLEVLVLLVLVRFLRETRRREDRERLPGERFDLKGALRSVRRLLWLLVPLAGDSFSWGIALSLLFGILNDRYSFSDGELGWINAFFSLSWAIAQIPVGRLVDRYGCKRFLLVSEIMSAGCLVMLMLWPTFVGVSIAYGLLGVTAALWVPALLKLIAGTVPEKTRGMVMGLVFTVQGLARFPAPLLAAWLYSTWGYTVPLAAGLAGAGVVIVLIAVLVRDPPKEPAGQHELAS